MAQSKATGPCAGLQVVDFTTMVAGSLAGQNLGDYGADVIKIEPLSGEMVRHFEPIHDGMSAHFLQHNRNKRSIALNLKTPEGGEIARALASRADVVLENSRPGVMDRLGLGPSHLQALNDKLVYVSINGFGPTGPYAQRPAYDHLLQGLVGAMVMQGQGGPPQPIYNAIADKITAVVATHAALAALYHREKSGGQGQHVSVSMLDAFATFFLSDQMYRYAFHDVEGLNMPTGKNYFPIATNDGHVIGMIASDQQFKAGCETFGAEELLADTRFATMSDRIANLEEMWAELAKFAANISTAEALRRAETHDLPLAPIQDVTRFFDDPQVHHNGTIVDIPDPEFGTVRQLGHPARFEHTPMLDYSRAPRLNEHESEILKNLGYSDDQIAQLKVQGAIG
ncbi:CaiB/BaiF CoA-transferase family protein [Rhodococcus sp. C3V]|uniref:CaiB/BaiF CoA transferase family protein n=1 Tax=Rhodococcus sp. C3V TaxID=3034165 RepID=UPI0023E1C9BB|nr:CaiB/BaiF CoA-transferase family protein [Rhodococcus sp. C3V]MDF3319982.1 CaiB/BaiF CoA-transferase family protein [Rhodococcus sp. C3V]